MSRYIFADVTDSSQEKLEMLQTYFVLNLPSIRSLFNVSTLLIPEKFPTIPTWVGAGITLPYVTILVSGNPTSVHRPR
jgi:hypothetical protein